MPLVSFDKVKLTNHTNLRHFVTETVDSRDIKTFEEMDMGWSSAFYSIRLPEILTPSLLMINEPHDFAQVFINGKYLSLIHISEPTRPRFGSRIPSSA